MARGQRTTATKIIVVAASKGGSGKTTVMTALGAQAALEGKVALIDVDPQESTVRFWELRGSPDNPKFFQIRGGLAATLDRVRAEGFDYAFIDTPPALLPTIQSAVHLADACLIVTQTTALDLEAIGPVVEMAKKAEVPFAFVLNRVEPRWRLETDAAKYLKSDGRVLKELVTNRQSYASAPVAGRSGAEVGDKVAAEEIAALWKAVKRMMSARAK